MNSAVCTVDRVKRNSWHNTARATRDVFECKNDRRGAGDQISRADGGQWMGDRPALSDRLDSVWASWTHCPRRVWDDARTADSCARTSASRGQSRELCGGSFVSSLLLTSQLFDQSAIDHAEKTACYRKTPGKTLPQEVEGAWKTWYGRVKVKQ